MASALQWSLHVFVKKTNVCGKRKKEIAFFHKVL